MQTNNAPQCKWWKQELACGTERHRLYVNGTETRYFVDVARYHAHRSYGSKVGLWGSGLGKQSSAPHGLCCAGFLGGFDKITLAKHRGEMLATEGR
jgi:hypothetical protein